MMEQWRKPHRGDKTYCVQAKWNLADTAKEKEKPCKERHRDEYERGICGGFRTDQTEEREHFTRGGCIIF